MFDENKNEQIQILLSFPWLKFSCPRADEKCVTLCPVCSCLLGHFAREPGKPASGSRRMENNMWPIREPLSTACFASSGPWLSASGVFCYFTGRLWLMKRPSGDRRHQEKTLLKINKALTGGPRLFQSSLPFPHYRSVSPFMGAQTVTARLLRWPQLPKGWQNQWIACKTTRVQGKGAFLKPLNHPPPRLRGS